jgi:hypothetical protein
MIKTPCLLLIAVSMVGCTRDQPLETPKGEAIDSEFIRRVVTVLQYSGSSGSLAYRGECMPSGGIIDSFKIAPPKGRSSAAQMLRDAFGSDPRLKVSEDTTGIVRVLGGKVQTDLLDIRIPEVAFHGETDPRDATFRLLMIPEVKAYMQDHHMSFINVIHIGPIPMPKAVRLTATLEDPTLSQALDRIAQAFPGVWTYGECAKSQGERLIYFDFAEFASPPHTEPIE